VREQLDRLIEEMVSKGILYDEARREFERRFIARALVRSNGNLCRAAAILGIHRNTLSRKIAEYRLTPRT
jgi:Fis family transcriptional regulator, factor for inversion stimulation protein